MRQFYMGLLILAYGCASDTRAPSTKNMSAYLSEKRDSAMASVNFPYYHDQVIKRMEDEKKGKPLPLIGNLIYKYGLALLMKGQNEKCILEMKKFIDRAFGQSEITPQSAPFYKVLALAHFRLGEVTNCIHDHSPQSCVVPIKGGGFHSFPEGVENAIPIYEKLLGFDSLDYQSKWFLNVAYMTLDRYPDQVEVTYLIPETLFQSHVDFPAFENKSMQANVALNNHAGGSIIQDFNNDGLQDIFTTGYSLSDQCALFINNGKGSFNNETKQWGLEGLTAGLNTLQADFDNNGFTDILILRGAWLGESGDLPNSILFNNGKRFEDKGLKTFGASYFPSGSAAIADFDLDGYVDIFFANEFNNTREEMNCQLFRNLDGKTFKNVSSNIGLEISDFVKGAVWGDINNDSYPDLFLSIYGNENKLFVNRQDENGKNFFEDITEKSGVKEPVYSFPCWFWDFNHDGFQDIMVFGYDNRESYLISDHYLKELLSSDLLGETPRLYLNNGDETFTDYSDEAGLKKSIYAMGANYGDLNNDGFLDFYAGTGEFNLWASVPNQMFLNVDGHRFEDVTFAGGFGQIQKGHGVSFGDLDNDGDQDIYHQVGGAAESDVFHNMLFENPGFPNKWISITVEGVTANRSGIGTRIELEVKDETDRLRTFYHYINSGGSFGSNTLRAEIGIDASKNITKIRVIWPDDKVTIQTFQDVLPNRHYYLRQGEKLKYNDLKTVSF
ncbi:MAG: VCBS repeat-containing protein [Bacteroidota bacterium]